MHPIALQYSVMWMSHGLFSELPVDGHLGCFQSFALVNSTIVCNSVHLSFHILARVLWRFLEVELLGQRVKVRAVLLDSGDVPSTGTEPFHILTRTMEDCLLPTALPIDSVINPSDFGI